MHTESDLQTALSNNTVTAITVAANITLSATPATVGRSLAVTGDPAACSPGLCTINGAGHRIFKVSSPSAPAVLSLTTLGLINASDAADGLGGGAVLLLAGNSAANSPSLTVTGCVFSGNNATGIGPGGAIAVNPSTLPATSAAMTITNSVFTSNYAFTVAGAIFAYGPTTVSGTTFSSNAATFPPTQLTNTSLGGPGSNGLGFGGALVLGTCGTPTTGSLTVTNGAFSSNAGSLGGGIVCGTDCVCTVTGTTFTANSATGAFLVGNTGLSGSGGAIAGLPGASIVASGATFSGNVAGNEGGAVWMSGTKQGSISYALGGLFGFSGHGSLASTVAAAVYTLPGGQASVALPAVLVQGAFTGCTFSGCTAVTGGCIYLEGNAGVLSLTNTAVSGGSATKKGGCIYSATSSNVTLTGVNASGCSSGLAGGALAVGGTANVTVSGGVFQSSSTLAK